MFKECIKTNYIHGSARHQSDIGHFLPGMEITLSVNYANVNSAPDFNSL